MNRSIRRRGLCCEDLECHHGENPNLCLSEWKSVLNQGVTAAEGRHQEVVTAEGRHREAVTAEGRHREVAAAEGRHQVEV